MWTPVAAALLAAFFSTAGLSTWMAAPLAALAAVAALGLTGPVRGARTAERPPDAGGSQPADADPYRAFASTAARLEDAVARAIERAVGEFDVRAPAPATQHVGELLRDAARLLAVQRGVELQWRDVDDALFVHAGRGCSVKALYLLAEQASREPLDPGSVEIAVQALPDAVRFAVPRTGAAPDTPHPAGPLLRAHFVREQGGRLGGDGERTWFELPRTASGEADSDIAMAGGTAR
jgi:hypothetical protein